MRNKDPFVALRESLRLQRLTEFTTEELQTEIQRRNMAAQGFYEEHWVDENDNPAGGVATGRGFTISWQNGPLGRVGTDERKEPNGAFVEDVVGAAKGRFQFYQDSKFACEENAECIRLLEQVEAICQSRTQRRTADKTEGTHEGK